MTLKQQVVRRVTIIYFIMIAISLIVIIKALYTQVTSSPNLASFGFKEEVVMANRGNICAADGRTLACSVPYFQLYWDATVPHDTLMSKCIDSLSRQMSRFFGDKSASQYRSELLNARKARSRYTLLNRRKVSFVDLKHIRNFSIFRMGRNKGGLIAERTFERVLPLGDLAGRTIGYLNESEGAVEGRVGIEQAFEKSLRGVPGRCLKQNMSGKMIPVTVEEPEDGYDVITTIDVDYQDIVQSALRRQMERFEAKHGTAILMEVKTGDIKAITNLSRSSAGVYREDVNHAIRNIGEPGSVMKAATMIALFEAGDYEPSDVIDLGGKGEYKFYNDKLTDSGDEKYGKITVQHIFEVSSNGIAKLVFDKYKNHPDRFVNRICELGIDRPLGLQIKGEGVPVITHPGDKTWSGISLPWMSIGYQMQLTPLQVLAFYNAIANNGQRMRPRIVKEIRSGGDVVESFSTEEVGFQMCGSSTLRKIKQLLEGVVENGTAMNIKTDKYRIAGKTGTARIATGTSGYSQRRYRASFVGYFPAEDPIYSCIVTIDEPATYMGYYAAQVCSPVFREIADKVYAMASLSFDLPDKQEPKTLPVCKNGLKDDLLRVFDELDIDVDEGTTEQTDWVLTSADEAADDILLRPRRVNMLEVPNVRGMGLRDAIFILENAGLRVGFTGSGMVMKQSLNPGDRIRHGDYIHLELR